MRRCVGMIVAVAISCSSLAALVRGINMGSIYILHRVSRIMAKCTRFVVPFLRRYDSRIYALFDLSGATAGKGDASTSFLLLPKQRGEMFFLLADPPSRFLNPLSCSTVCRKWLPAVAAAAAAEVEGHGHGKWRVWRVRWCSWRLSPGDGDLIPSPRRHVQVFCFYVCLFPVRPYLQHY